MVTLVPSWLLGAGKLLFGPSEEQQEQEEQKVALALSQARLRELGNLQHRLDAPGRRQDTRASSKQSAPPFPFLSLGVIGATLAAAAGVATIASLPGTLILG